MIQRGDEEGGKGGGGGRRGRRRGGRAGRRGIEARQVLIVDTVIQIHRRPNLRQLPVDPITIFNLE